MGAKKSDTGKVTGIDPNSWQATILPLPKRFTRGTAFGFCGGHPVGTAEAARTGSSGCWWPKGQPELLVLEGQKHVSAGRAIGNAIPGQWRHPTTGAMGAIGWSLQGDSLVATDLHDRSFENTWATDAAGGIFIGVGSPPRKPDQPSYDVGLVWSGGKKATMITSTGDVRLSATDGTRLAGGIRRNAMLWPSATAAPIDLAPEEMFGSHVEALDGDYQIGSVWKGMCARAALWRGTAASFCDLTPKGYQTANAYGAASGYQVGFVRRKDTTRNGSTGSDNRAMLWQGAADRWIDLNAFLPEKKYNASVAWAIEIRGDEVRVCGTASQYELSHPGTPQESHAVPVAHPVLWTARLAKG